MNAVALHMIVDGPVFVLRFASSIFSNFDSQKNATKEMVTMMISMAM